MQPANEKILYFRVSGMDCAEEVAVLKREIGPVAGGEKQLSFDILKGKMGVSIPENSSLEEADIIQAVAKTGMKAEIWKTRESVEQTFWQRRQRLILTSISGFCVLLGFLSHSMLQESFRAAIGSEGMGIAHKVPFLPKLFYLAAIISGSYYILPKAWFALKRLRPDMNLLMTIAVIGAVLIGEWFEGATVAFLFALSLTLEAWSVGRARKAVSALMNLSPPSATLLLPGGIEKEVQLEEVTVGSIFVVKPGERIPLDGKVIDGMSDVNQAPITGESTPVTKKLGSEVFAGTINGDGALEVQSTKESGDTTLAHIVKLVDQAQSKRAQAEQWVEKFARFYTPAVMILALIFLLVPPLLFNQSWQEWVYRSLVLLVIACPCALVISTPVSVVAALTAAARKGVLIKGGTYIELPASLRAIAMDKTGTLTEGKPSVEQFIHMSGHTSEELISIAAAMETRSDHPLAKAIMKYAAEKSVSTPAAENFKIIQGKGATATIDGKEYWLGSHKYLEERNQETPDVHTMLESFAQTGRSVVMIGDSSHVCGMIALGDRVRPDAKGAVQALRDSGIEHIILLTGDNKGTAEAVARQTGVDEVYAELLPQDKVTGIESLVTKYEKVAMVGDGVNDAPAMARATLGIEMGAVGTDVAIETADIALMSDDLTKLSWLIKHSKKTLSIIRKNIVFSLAVKAVFVILTFTGHASLWGAIAADMGASLLVIFNGLRLLGLD